MKRASLHSTASNITLRTIAVAQDSNKEEFTPHHGREIIEINAGGTRYTTLLDTLAHSKSAYFENFIQNDKNSASIFLHSQRFLRDSNDAIFINRDGYLFKYVLQFMRDRTKTVLPTDVSLLKQLKREADFFGMEAFVIFIQQAIDLENQRNGYDDSARFSRLDRH